MNAKASPTKKPRAARSVPKAAPAAAVPVEWQDDVQQVPSVASGDREHDLNRDCWCGPRLINVPTVEKGSPEPVFKTMVRHRR